MHKEFICAYKHCLHKGSRVNSLEAVCIGNKYYHMDCASTHEQIKRIASAYIDYREDKTEYPIVLRIINNLHFINRVPLDYIEKKVISSKRYYELKPVQALYGLKKLFYTYEFVKK